MSRELPEIAVIGAQGQLGSDLVQVLRAAGRYRVSGFGRAELDVTDHAAVDREIVPGRFAAVVNAAALTNVDLCEEQGDAALAVNSAGAYLVARACARAGAKNVLIGTDFVFAGDKGESYDENDVPAPVNIYGASKLAGETLALLAAPRPHRGGAPSPGCPPRPDRAARAATSSKRYSPKHDPAKR